MSGLQAHANVLELAAAGRLPNSIDDTSNVSVEVVLELYEAGYLEAIDSSHLTGRKLERARITLAGREYLEHLRSQVANQSMPASIRRGVWKIVAWIAGILGAVIAGVWIARLS